jgi:HAE1 family hydrophobic/amphiphilic exporter-1
MVERLRVGGEFQPLRRAVVIVPVILSYVQSVSSLLATTSKAGDRDASSGKAAATGDDRL